jgi:hypothetical protein
MRRIPAIVMLLAGLACMKDKTPTLADFAGTWDVTSHLQGVDNPVPSTLKGSADAASWTLSLEGRPDVPVTVSVVGDSLIVQSAEYESVLRPGVMVTVRTAGVRNGDKLEGTVVATYKTPSGDEVVHGTMEAMRKM